MRDRIGTVLFVALALCVAVILLMGMVTIAARVQPQPVWGFVVAYLDRSSGDVSALGATSSPSAVF
jgi:hypothetical protein